MACFNPLRAYRGKDGAIFFSQLARTGGGDTIWLPCGQCIGCKLDRSRMWAIRCVHEAELYRRNCMVTLTYSPENLPPAGNLVYRDFQLFMKRLRKRRLSPFVRFFMCGEYGTENRRPHFHACLFNVDFDFDKYEFRGRFRSPTLEELWGFGMCDVGELNFKSAAYCARYICDKVTGDLAEDHYKGLEPEFCHMSLKPGIGAAWLEKFRADVYPHGRVEVNGKEVKPPRYYERLFQRLQPLDSDELKAQRELAAVASVGDRTVARLKVREEVARARLSQLKRSL